MLHKIDLQSERVISLSEVPDYLPLRRGKKVNYQTVWRWKRKGARGRILSTVQIGRTHFTSIEALKVFLGEGGEVIDMSGHQDAIDLELARSGT